MDIHGHMTANGHLVAYTTGEASLPWNASQEVGMIKLSGTIINNNSKPLTSFYKTLMAIITVSTFWQTVCLLQLLKLDVHTVPLYTVY